MTWLRHSTRSLPESKLGMPCPTRISSQLGASRDIIMLGMLATIVRRRLHGTEVTYVRVADLKVGAGGTLEGPAHARASQRDSAGEVRIFETPKTLETAEDVVARARETAGRTPLSAFCLYELE